MAVLSKKCSNLVSAYDLTLKKIAERSDNPFLQKILNPDIGTKTRVSKTGTFTNDSTSQSIMTILNLSSLSLMQSLKLRNYESEVSVVQNAFLLFSLRMPTAIAIQFLHFLRLLPCKSVSQFCVYVMHSQNPRQNHLACS